MEKRATQRATRAANEKRRLTRGARVDEAQCMGREREGRRRGEGEGGEGERGRGKERVESERANGRD